MYNGKSLILLNSNYLSSMMELFVTTIIVAASVFFIFIILTKRENEKLTESQKQLAFFTFLLGLWSVANFYSLTSTDEIATLFWIRSVLFLTIPLVTVLLFFLDYYPDDKSKINTKTRIVLLFLVILTSPIYFTPFVVNDVSLKNGNIIPAFSTGMIFYITHIISLLLWSGSVLMQKRKNSIGVERTRLQYLGMGILFTTVPAIITNLIFVVILKQSRFVVLGPFFELFFITFSTVSIIKHRLFGINIILGNILKSLVTAIIPFSVFYLVITIEGDIKPFLKPEILLLNIPVAFIYRILDDTISERINSTIKKSIITSKYDPEEFLRLYASKAGHTLTLNDLVVITNNILVQTLKIKGSYISFFDPENDTAILFRNKFGELESLSLKHDSISLLLDFFSSHPNIITREDLEIITSYNNTTIQQNISLILEFMQKNNISAMLPIFGKVKQKKEKVILGFILLSERQQDIAYAKEDIEFLNNLTTQISISASKATYIQKFQNLNRTLQKKVDLATKKLRVSNKELKELYDNLEDLYQKEKDLMDIAGHELRTPASILKNNLYLLKNRLKQLMPDVEDEKVEKYLERLVESTDRQIRLINTFLESARIENKKFGLNIENADFAELITKAVEDSAHLTKGKSLKLIYIPPTKKIFIDMDPLRIREVIDNLLSNAIKYTNEGYVEIKVDEDTGTVACSITDTGIGIHKEDTPALFKKFSRIETHISSGETKLVRPGGTGLGLYVSKNIIDAHKGKITLESKVGKGSTFKFEIPKVQEKSAFGRFVKESKKIKRS